MPAAYVGTKLINASAQTFGLSPQQCSPHLRVQFRECANIYMSSEGSEDNGRDSEQEAGGQ
jgi:hypothetical protein